MVVFSHDVYDLRLLCISFCLCVFFVNIKRCHSCHPFVCHAELLQVPSWRPACRGMSLGYRVSWRMCRWSAGDDCVACRWPTGADLVATFFLLQRKITASGFAREVCREVRNYHVLLWNCWSCTMLPFIFVIEPRCLYLTCRDRALSSLRYISWRYDPLVSACLVASLYWDSFLSPRGRLSLCVCIWLGQVAQLLDACAELRVSCAFRTVKYGKIVDWKEMSKKAGRKHEKGESETESDDTCANTFFTDAWALSHACMWHAWEKCNCARAMCIKNVRATRECMYTVRLGPANDVSSTDSDVWPIHTPRGEHRPEHPQPPPVRAPEVPVTSHPTTESTPEK